MSTRSVRENIRDTACSRRRAVRFNRMSVSCFLIISTLNCFNPVNAFALEAQSSPANFANCDGPKTATADSNDAESDLRDFDNRGPTCGILSLYACLSAIGVEIDPAKLVRPEFIGTGEGSSVAELILAAKETGVHADCITHMSHSDLERCPGPMVLHMRSMGKSEAFTHWVAFLGFAEGKIRIADGPNEIHLLTPAEVLANWDGLGILISNKKLSHFFVLESRVHLVVLVGFAMIIVWWTDKIIQSIFKVQASGLPGADIVALSRQLTTIALTALVTATLFHSISSVGFFRNPGAVAEVKRRFYNVDVPEVSLSQLESELKEGQLLLLDSRRDIDFKLGSIPKAVSLPINSNLAQRIAVLKNVPRDKRIVVFCQSARCGYADEIANFLQFNSYTNVVIYRDGFRGWQSSRAKGGDL